MLASGRVRAHDQPDAGIRAVYHYKGPPGPRDFLTKHEMRFPHQYNTKTKIRKGQLRENSWGNQRY